MNKGMVIFLLCLGSFVFSQESAPGQSANSGGMLTGYALSFVYSGDGWFTYAPGFFGGFRNNLDVFYIQHLMAPPLYDRPSDVQISSLGYSRLLARLGPTVIGLGVFGEHVYYPGAYQQNQSRVGGGGNIFLDIMTDGKSYFSAMKVRINFSTSTHFYDFANRVGVEPKNSVLFIPSLMVVF